MDANASWTPLTPAGGRAIDAITADPQGTLLALDFDGTLSPIVADPSSARIHPRSRAALARLVGRLGQVAIVTGRPVSVVRGLAGLDKGDWTGLVVLGQYGVERWDAGTDRLRSPEPPAGLDQVRDGIEQVLVGLGALGVATRGASIEDKGRALALHTRTTSQPQQVLDLALAQVANLAAARGLAVEPGRFVVEVRAAGTTKADALGELLDERSEDGFTIVVMGGDDLGDLPALELVHQLPTDQLGINLVSGSSERSALDGWADVLTTGPQGVADWLTVLADRVEAGAGSAQQH